MNFKQRREPDLGKLAQVLGVAEEMKKVNMIEQEKQDVVRRFAPPALREQALENQPENQVKSFGELPTSEIDEVVSAAEAEITALKLEGQAVRDLYVKHTTRIMSRIGRLRATVKLSMNALASLKDQCAKLDDEDEDVMELPFKSEKD